MPLARFATFDVRRWFARASSCPPRPGNNRTKLSREGTHACARCGVVWCGVVRLCRPTGELAAKALSLSDVTNAAFNAQTSQVSYYYSRWQHQLRAQALSLSLFLSRLPFLFPFRVPSEQKTSFPSSFSPWPPGPNRCCAALALCLSLSLWTRWFIHSVNRRPGRQVSVIVSRVGRVWGKKGTCPRLGLDRGVFVLVFDEIHRPERWDPLFY